MRVAWILCNAAFILYHCALLCIPLDGKCCGLSRFVKRSGLFFLRVLLLLLSSCAKEDGVVVVVGMEDVRFVFVACMRGFGLLLRLVSFFAFYFLAACTTATDDFGVLFSSFHEKTNSSTHPSYCLRISCTHHETRLDSHHLRGFVFSFFFLQRL